MAAVPETCLPLLSSCRADGEPLSPFVPWMAEDRAPLHDSTLDNPGRPHLLADVLRNPAAVVDRLLDPVRTLPLVAGSVGLVLLGTGFFTAVAASAQGPLERLSVLAHALLAGTGLLLAVAASLGPVYAAGILVAARVPLARLSATLLTATATGALVLVGLAPPLYVAWKVDAEWLGPLGLVLAFGAAGVVGGVRIHVLLRTMAEAVTRAALRDPTARLGAQDAYRVGILSRVALVLVGFTSALAFWAFDAFTF